jgi:hypothetical protein
MQEFEGVKLSLAMHYRHVVSQHGEAALPSFDLNKKVGRKIKLQKYRRAVVLCVVDMADFDGSLPREALQELLPGLEEGEYGSQAGLGYRLVVAASKVDLLPPQATQTRLQVQSCKISPPVTDASWLHQSWWTLPGRFTSKQT